MAVINYKSYKAVASIALGVYLGFIGANVYSHGYLARDAKGESQKACYGENLRQEWKDYAKFHSDQLHNPKILIPFSSLNDLQKPLTVRIIGSGLEGMSIKLDVGKKVEPVEKEKQ